MDIENSIEGLQYFDRQTLEDLDYVVNKYGMHDFPDTNYLVSPIKQSRIFSNFFDIIDVPKGSKILEFGPGAGFGIHNGIRYGFNMWGIDINQIEANGIYSFDFIHQILGIKDKIKKYDGHGEFPFKDNEFDVLISKNAIHHAKTIDDSPLTKTDVYIQRFEEITRILKPSSKLYIKSAGRSKLCQDYLDKMGNPKDLKVMCWDRGEIVEYEGRDTHLYFKEKYSKKGKKNGELKKTKR